MIARLKPRLRSHHALRLRRDRPSRRVRSLATFSAVALSATLFAQDGQWLMYSGSFSSHRFSALTQLSPANVGRLKPVSGPFAAFARNVSP